MNKIEIPLSKTKLLVGTGCSILMIVLCFYLFTKISDQQTPCRERLPKNSSILFLL